MPCDDFDGTLRRLQNNDPSLTSLDITRFSHPNPADWEALGGAIAGNSLLKYIAFDEPAAVIEQHLEILCQGLRRNTSITSVYFLAQDDATLGSLFQCLAPFLAKREVNYISIAACHFDPSSCSLIGGVLARCTFLRKIEFFGCRFDEETSAEIIESFVGRKSLESIRIHGSGVWTGWDYLINHLRFSNHTLKSIEYIRVGGEDLPQDLNNLLTMNRMEDKKALAIQKGLYFNFLVGKFDATPYHNLEKEPQSDNHLNKKPKLHNGLDSSFKRKCLPHIMATISGGGSDGSSDDGRSETQRLSALLHFIRNMPLEIFSNLSN